MVRTAIVGLALVATPAVAQTTNTTCRTIGNTLNCQSNTQSNQIPNYAQAMRDAQESVRANDGETGQAKSDLDDMKAEVWVRCRKKWNEALEKRDFDLANAIVARCPANP